MVNYEYGKIYKLYSKQQNITYIGSTAEYYLSKRLQKHLTNYKQYLKNNADYVTAFKILECEDYKIEILEDYHCVNKNQLEIRESYYKKNNECVNKNIPRRSSDQYYQDNKERKKEYREANKDKIEEYQKEYRKKYRTNNKDKLEALASQKITCECGCQIRRGSISVHKNSKKHIRLMELVQNI